MHAVAARLLLLVITISLLLSFPVGAQAKSKPRLKSPAKKFLVQQDRLRRKMAAGERDVLRAIAEKRKDLKKCPVFKKLPRDTYQRQKSFLYVLVDMAQETTAPYAESLQYAADAYRKPAYGDGVLNRAARNRYSYLRATIALKPYDSCELLKEWASNKWRSDWRPLGDLGDASEAIYDGDIQLPDEGALLRRLKKLGASSKQRSRTRSFGQQKRIYDKYDSVLRELFPGLDMDWR